MNVLVLGVGGNIGQGILKALRLSSLRCRVVGACVSPMAMGLYTVDKAFVSPAAAEPSFEDWLYDTCRDEGVDAVLCGVEPVLDVLSPIRDALFDVTGARCIVSAPDTLAIGRDKLRTCQWLEEQGLNFPQYALNTNRAGLDALVAKCGFPLIAKPRFGKGGEGILHLGDTSELAFLAQRKDYVVQEYLGTPKDEYTAGVFVDNDRKVRGSIVMWRELQAGTTYRAEVGEFPELRAEAVRIASALGPMGPCNVQLRMAGGRAVCFEINIRFSGTTPMRAHFGYNEVEAALRHFVLDEAIDNLPSVTEGIGLRYWNEIYVSPPARDRLRNDGSLDNPRDHASVEDFGTRSCES